MENDIHGEYQMVSRRLQQYTLLARAHAEPIEQDEARTLVEMLAEHYQLAYPVLVHFRHRSPGRISRTKDGKRLILLPSFPMPKVGGPFGKQVGYLRVGIVLHEFAHVLDLDTAKRHGTGFVHILDELLLLTEGLW